MVQCPYCHNTTHEDHPNVEWIVCPDCTPSQVETIYFGKPTFLSRFSDALNDLGIQTSRIDDDHLKVTTQRHKIEFVIALFRCAS